jgi:hypothetical protein
MDLSAFKKSTASANPPSAIGLALEALWWDAKGEWDKAHGCAQQIEDRPDGQWVHAYLHRKEGDLDNAGYWYRMAKRPVAQEPLAEEWETIARALLQSA